MTARPVETPVSVAVSLPPATGTGSHDVEIRGRSYARQPGWCDRHGLPSAVCRFCADPSLLDDDRELVMEGDSVRAGMAVREVVALPDGRLVLGGPVNSRPDGGMW